MYVSMYVCTPVANPKFDVRPQACIHACTCVCMQIWMCVYTHTELENTNDALRISWVAVCCIVLQGFAVCCSVLQRDAVCGSVLQCVAVENTCRRLMNLLCSVLQCVAVCCSVLMGVAVCCSVLQCVAVCVAVRCSEFSYLPPRVMQCVVL